MKNAYDIYTAYQGREIYMIKNITLACLFAVGVFVSSPSLAQTYNNSFNNNSGNITINNNSGGGYGGGYYGGGYVPVTPVYYYTPVYYTYPVYQTYYYTVPTYTVQPYYGHGTIRIRGRW